LDALVETDARDRARWLAARARRLAARALRVNGLFLCLVLVPTALAVLYFGFLAHDVYVADSQFVVRTVQRQLPTGLGSLLQGSGLTQGSSDVYSVQSFLASRDALQVLEAPGSMRSRASIRSAGTTASRICCAITRSSSSTPTSIRPPPSSR